MRCGCALQLASLYLMHAEHAVCGNMQCPGGLGREWGYA